jgi:hypothetical protein
MAKTPWEMAEVGSEFSHQTALFAWAAMARLFGPAIANQAESYAIAGYAKQAFERAYVLKGENVNGIIPIVELKWLHAIKNQGHGDKVRGARSNAEGLRAGVFDVFLPVTRELQGGAKLEGGLMGHQDAWIYCGLYIELKTPDRINHKDGGASDVQLDFQVDMRAAGYAAEICHGWQAARDCLLTYLGKSQQS